MNILEEKEEVKKKNQFCRRKFKKMQPFLHGNSEYPKRKDMDRGSIRSNNLKENRLQAGKQNMKIISDKKIKTFFL